MPFPVTNKTDILNSYICTIVHGSWVFSNPVTHDHAILMCSPIRLKPCHSSDEVYSVSSILGMLHYYVNQQPVV